MLKGIGFIKLYSVYLNMSCVFRNEISKQPGLTFPGTMWNSPEGPILDAFPIDHKDAVKCIPFLPNT